MESESWMGEDRKWVWQRQRQSRATASATFPKYLMMYIPAFFSLLFSFLFPHLLAPSHTFTMSTHPSTPYLLYLYYICIILYVDIMKYIFEYSTHVLSLQLSYLTLDYYLNLLLHTIHYVSICTKDLSLFVHNPKGKCYSKLIISLRIWFPSIFLKYPFAWRETFLH